MAKQKRRVNCAPSEREAESEIKFTAIDNNGNLMTIRAKNWTELHRKIKEEKIMLIDKLK